ncbi:hypothetical protein [Telluria beijingensis]|uniref:hypothetical protein n=1 Tax=Telluria beijingensis TaxID=3068633 RepID=UPI002795AD14|nr:hypothetical protein [Massilia sp. REN29]
MVRDTEIYRGYTLSASALIQRQAGGGWSGSFVLAKDGVELERIAVAGPLESELAAVDNAIRVGRLRIDQLVDG